MSNSLIEEKYFCLIGKTLTHSRSPEIINGFFAEKGIDARYGLCPIEDISLLPGIIRSCGRLCGFNVTIPYKQAVMAYLDELTPEAKAVGAVNTVKIRHEHGGPKLIGHNTDVEGFAKSLEDLLEDKSPKKNALILGTGGASLAVETALKKLNYSNITHVSRDINRSPLTYFMLKDKPDILSSADILVNATPLGTYPDNTTKPDIPYAFLRPDAIAFDLVYNPEETSFMKACRKQGAKVSNGLKMLYYQALGALKFWGY